MLSMFQQFKTILCICPKCNSLLRFSDLHLRSRGKAPKTWLDLYGSKEQEIDRQESKFDEKEAEIREKARQRGRAKVPVLVRKSMDKQFAKLSYDPYDIKPLLHPVDFAVFDGLNNKSLDNIILLSTNTPDSNLKILQKAVANAVANKQYDWKVARVSIDGKIEYEQ
jgi:predicted Holliday junction resolvase-like endonuclease